MTPFCAGCTLKGLAGTPPNPRVAWAVVGGTFLLALLAAWGVSKLPDR